MEHTAELREPLVCGYGDICYLIGYVFNDRKHRWPNGEDIRTSKVVLAVGQTVFTKNSTYKVQW